MKSILKSREINAVVQGLRDQGAEVSLVSGGQYKVSHKGHMISLALGAGDTRILLNSKTKLRTLGLTWPLDESPKKKAPTPTKPDEDLEAAAVAAREKALAAEARIASVAPTGGSMAKLGTQSDEILQEWVKITPHLAEQYLAHNISNRNLRADHVRAMARDMEAGNWRKTGESIKFDRGDRLIDGQHRLHAIIMSGVTCEMLMVVGLDPDVRQVIDTGAVRRASDAIHFEDPSIRGTTGLASIARLAILRDQGRYHTAFDSVNPKVTNAEVVDWVRKNPDVVAARDLAQKSSRATGIPLSVWGYALLTLMRLDEDAARDFSEALGSYRTNGDGDPLWVLLNVFQRAQRDRRRLKQGEALFYIYRVWNGWRTGEEMHRLNATGGGNIGGAPVPEPI